ncbi:hypothetical protein [Aquimarina sp. RZ0]|uniref:hypothetical protein n=1 Tax=Aquimarina sp. RZ0 TaxID=2607730 RepID=UPI0011F3ACEB|nr:hypothetical protein [Aquimarina sp. RZ0]KAA1244082.1 hypothetical protein F0000_18340 [Aquimarina sp. RZ0]
MKTKIIMVLFLCSSFIRAQHLHLEKHIDLLNQKIEGLNVENRKTSNLSYNSLSQTSAHYFEIQTENPNKFIERLLEVNDLQILITEYPNLITDFDLLLVRNIYKDYDDKKIIKFRTYEIGNGQDHEISFPIKKKWQKDNLKTIYKIRTNKKKGNTTVSGFLLRNNFITKKIPLKYKSYIAYTDKIIDPDFNLFIKSDNNNTSNFASTKVFDDLSKYYQRATNKPVYDKDKYDAYLDQQKKWLQKKRFFSDSLFKHDTIFQQKLFAAIDFAKENKTSNTDLEFFIGQLISKKTAINFMRKNPRIGSCSFDNSPRAQLAEMARISASIANWDVFIKSSMNLLNDRANRIASSNIATNSRDTYINQLELLNLDIPMLLIGSGIKIQAPRKGHYFSDSNKIGQAFANSFKENKNRFEDIVGDIISNPEMDTFNKLHFYNTYQNYKHFIVDSIEKQRIQRHLDTLIKQMPYELKSRIERPDKQLEDLLIREKELIDKYDITKSVIAHVSSYSFSGYSWNATLNEKNENEKIFYNLRMSLEDSLTPLRNFETHKKRILKRIKDHNFLMKLAEDGSINSIHINFTNNKSFVNHRGRETEDMPIEILAKIDLKDAISFYTFSDKRKSLRWILTKDGKLILLKIFKDIKLANYTFEELLTKTEKSALFSTKYYSYRGFDSSGNLIF